VFLCKKGKVTFGGIKLQKRNGKTILMGVSNEEQFLVKIALELKSEVTLV
jgi:hypothetical protein